MHVSRGVVGGRTVHWIPWKTKKTSMDAGNGIYVLWKSSRLNYIPSPMNNINKVLIIVILPSLNVLIFCLMSRFPGPHPGFYSIYSILEYLFIMSQILPRF